MGLISFFGIDKFIGIDKVFGIVKFFLDWKVLEFFVDRCCCDGIGGSYGG